MITEDRTSFLSLQSAFPLDEITVKFDIMFRSFSTSLFHEMWQDHMKKAATAVKRRERSELTIEDIKTAIWNPAFDESIHLLTSLRDKSIKLAEVDRYFSRIEDRKMQLMQLHTGVQRACSTKVTSTEWINDAIYCMEQYWSLLNLASAAETVITLKEKLRLTGDFSLIETLANQVYSY